MKHPKLCLAFITASLAGTSLGAPTETTLKFKPETFSLSEGQASLKLSFQFDESFEPSRNAKAAVRGLVERSGALTDSLANFSFDDDLVFTLDDSTAVTEKQHGFGQCLASWVLTTMDSEEAGKVFLAIREDDGNIDRYSSQFADYIRNNSSCFEFSEQLPDDHVLNTYLDEYVQNDHFNYNQGFIKEYGKLYAKPLEVYSKTTFGVQAKGKLLNSAKEFIDRFAQTGRNKLDFKVIERTIASDDFSKGQLFQSIVVATNSMDSLISNYEKILAGEPGSKSFKESLELASRIADYCDPLASGDNASCQQKLRESDFIIFTVARGDSTTKFISIED